MSLDQRAAEAPKSPFRGSVKFCTCFVRVLWGFGGSAFTKVWARAKPLDRDVVCEVELVTSDAVLLRDAAG